MLKQKVLTAKEKLDAGENAWKQANADLIEKLTYYQEKLKCYEQLEREINEAIHKM